MKWEHLLYTPSGGSAFAGPGAAGVQRALDEASEEGWELVAAGPSGSPSVYWLFFKRPAQEKPSELRRQLGFSTPEPKPPADA